MALPGSGTITIAMLKSEFGTGANSLSQYYRGGGIVPDTGTNANVPTSGTISLSNFYGAAAYTPMNVSKSGDATGSGSTSVAFGSVQVTTDVVTISVSNGTGPFSYNWTLISGAGATIMNQGTNATSFRRTASVGNVDGEPNIVSGTFRCTVTDATSATATIDVVATTYHYYVAV